MELEFQLSEKDYKEFWQYSCRASIVPNRKNKKLNWLFLITLGLVLLVVALVYYFFPEQREFVFLGIVIGAFVVLLLVGASSKSMSLSNQDMFDPQKIMIGEKQVINSSQKCTFEAQWTWFLGFVETPNLFILLVDKGRGIPLPKRAFKDEAQMEEFRKLCREKIPASA